MIRRTRTEYPLAELALFADISRSELQRASSLLTAVRLGPGEVLVKQGTVGREFMIVADGLVGVSRDIGDGSEPLASVSQGAVIGEMALLHGGPRSATVTTLAPTTVYVGTPQEFFSLLDAVPSAAEEIVRTANERLRANMAA